MCQARTKGFGNSSSAAAKSFQSCPTLCNPVDGSPPGSPIHGILQARTLVGCHFLLQCMKVKSESEVSQSCPTLRDPMDYSLPGSSVHGSFQAKVLERGAIAFSGIVHLRHSTTLHSYEEHNFFFKTEVRKRRKDIFK